MSKKLYAKKKKWYDKELKTRDGEVIVLMDNDAFNIKHDTDDIGLLDKFWIEEKPRLIFKQESDITSLFAEIFSSFFYNKFGLKTIEARPAVSVKNRELFVSTRQGFLSEDFVKNRVKDKDIYLSEFLSDKTGSFHSVAEHYVALNVLASDIRKNYKELYEVEIDSEIDKNLTKLVLFDYLTHNVDRHKKNIAYLLIKKEDTIKIKLAKVFDNGMSFWLVSPIKNKILEAIQENDKLSFEKFINKIRPLRFGITSRDYKYGDFNDDNYKRINQNVKKSLAKEIKSKKWLANLFNKILKTSFDDIIEDIKLAIPNFKYNQEDYILAKYIFEYKKDELSKELKKTQNREKY